MAASSAVVTLGRTAAAIARSALATMRPQALSFSSCSGLVMDMRVRSSSVLRDRYALREIRLVILNEVREVKNLSFSSHSVDERAVRP